MSDDFDDIMESIPTNDFRESDDDENLSNNFSENFNSVKFLDMLESESDIGDFADKLNPEMKSQVLVPLANLLDKYGFSDKIGTSQTTQSAFNVIGLLSLILSIFLNKSANSSSVNSLLLKINRSFILRM